MFILGLFVGVNLGIAAALVWAELSRRRDALRQLQEANEWSSITSGGRET